MQVLHRDLPAALAHDAAALHRTRVASRRIREALRVVQGEQRAPGARKGRRTVRRLTRALGGVRELDVALGILGELEGREPGFARPVAIVRGAIEREREARRERMALELAAFEPKKVMRRVSSLVERADEAPGDERKARLARSLRARVNQLESSVADAGALYAFDRLHAVRIQVKKLRYTLEMVREVGGLGTERLLRPLKGIQDLLGRLHDLEVLAGFVRASLGPSAPEPAGGEALLATIEREARERHAGYLSNLPRLRRVLQECRVVLGPRLSGEDRPAAGHRASSRRS